MLKLTNMEKVALVIMIFCIGAIPAWRFIFVPGFMEVPKDFSLKIEFNSYGKEYDANMKIISENLAKVFLDVRVKSFQDDFVVLDSIFDARTLSGETIYKNERQYKAYIETGKSVTHDHQQDIWIVFPKHMEKKSYTSPYFVRVDPVKFEFLGENRMMGLTVYHYRGSSTVDATKLFSFEKGVPEERGVINSVQADLWIEPVSGHIVKLIDSGENNYKDPNTNRILFKRNTYENTFSDDTISRHVQIAQDKKESIYIFEIIVPLLLTAIALAMLIAVLINTRMRRLSPGLS